MKKNMAPPTIIAHKSTFINTQTLHLSQPLEPSAAWRAANEAAEDGLSDRRIDDVLYRLNHILTQHARRVYAPQASRHVAEQIEGLFHADAERALRGKDHEGYDGDGAEVAGEKQQLRVGTDFTTDEAIGSLPSTWDLQNPREAESHPPEARRYAELATELTSLCARRREARDRVERLRKISALLAPFESSDGGGGGGDDSSVLDGNPAVGTRTPVQDNLITRNGEIERELERMRLLLARVAGRIARLPEKKKKSNDADGFPVEEEDEEADEGNMDIDSIEQGKIQHLLDRL
ncbi:kinetochore Sim4 complex subunit Fta4 [Poronia punctata]|nr:kinetochore Sim4 complex subunit Fta4 [Poronia punctata]